MITNILSKIAHGIIGHFIISNCICLRKSKLGCYLLQNFNIYLTICNIKPLNIFPIRLHWVNWIRNPMSEIRETYSKDSCDVDLDNIIQFFISCMETLRYLSIRLYKWTARLMLQHLKPYHDIRISFWHI